MKKKIKFRGEIFLLVIIQIFLLINMIAANSYMIYQTNNLIENSIIEQKEKNKIKNLVGLGINLLTGFLSIKQIGIVSAQDTVDYDCCFETNEGGICQDIISGTLETEPKSCSEPNPNPCKDTTNCEFGWCFDPDEGFCTPNSPHQKCTDDGGEWNEYWQSEKCEEACCIAHKNTQFSTETRCENVLRGYIDKSISEIDCKYYSLTKGACVLEKTEKNCIFTTEEDCIKNLNGDFHEGLYCSDESLKDFGVTCEREATGCYDTDIYWFDTCENPEEIKKDCEYPFKKCVESNGNPSCEDLGCTDEDGNERKNGESWCVYDAHVGESRDVVGSRHWRRYCIEGEIKLEPCADYRGQVCAVKKIPLEEGGTISQSQCRNNLGFMCFLQENQEECEIIPDCRMQSVNVDENFKFDVCVPKYPKGFDIDSINDMKNGITICGLGTQTCTVVYEQRLFADGICKRECKDEHEGKCRRKCRVACRKKCRKHVIANGDCKEKEFVEQMNDICISLGDCGGYVNIEGRYEKNFKTSEEGYQEGLENKEQEYSGYLTKANLVVNTPLYIFNYKSGSYGDILSLFNDSIDAEWSEEFGEDVETAVTILSGIGLTLGGVAAMVGWNPAGWIIGFIAFLIGLVGQILKLFGVGEITEVDIKFTCLPWKPPIGGEDCSQCNKDSLKPCTEYRCKSLGAACELLDIDVENPPCTYEYSDDLIAPVISFLEAGEYRGFPEIEGTIEKGVQIKTRDNKCIEGFTTVDFSLETDEYSECKYDYDSTSNYENMADNYPSDKNGHNWKIHNFSIKIPPLDNPDVSATGEYDIYVRCQDRNGNSHGVVNEYIVRFCIGDIPDLTAPAIEKTEPENQGFLKYEGVTDNPLKIYLSEPAECRYDVVEGKSYETMSNTFESCDDYTEEPKLEYSCSTFFTTEVGEDFEIYIKCNDTSENINSKDYPYILYTTKSELSITSISPVSGTIIRGPVSIDLEITTSGGINNGVSTCKYQFEDCANCWDYFPEETAEHKYTFKNLPEGDYNIEITCWDEIGNSANAQTEFKVEIDKIPPNVTRAYYKNGKLNLITNEVAECYYDFEICKFTINNETRKFDSTIAGYSTEHNADWITGQTYHIKCRDIWGNSNTDCAIKVIPSHSFQI